MLSTLLLCWLCCRAIAVCNGKGTLCLDGHPLMLVPMEACRDISKGEEITFDYSPMEDKDIDRLLKQQQRAGHGRGRPVKQKGADGQPVLKLEGKIKCECGAKSCRCAWLCSSVLTRCISCGSEL